MDALVVANRIPTTESASTATTKGPVTTTTLQHSSAATRDYIKSDSESYESDGLDDVPLATVMRLRRQQQAMAPVVRQGCLSRNSKQGNGSHKARVRFADEVIVRQDADEQLDQAYILKNDDVVVVKAQPRAVQSVCCNAQGYQQRRYLPSPALPRRLSSLGYDGRSSMPQVRHNVHRRYNEAVTPVVSHRRAACALASVMEEEQSQVDGRERGPATDEPRTAADLFHAHRQQALSSTIFDEPLPLLSPPSYAQLQAYGRVPRPVRSEVTQYSNHTILGDLFRVCLFVCSTFVSGAAAAAPWRYEDFANTHRSSVHSVPVAQGHRDTDGLYIESLDMECDFFFGHQAYELPPQYQDVSVRDTSLLGRCLRRAVGHLW
ncbi:unnamed protein product [Jaminaea pallidilutea]